jgi:3-dehydroquinate dehydratase-2
MKKILLMHGANLNWLGKRDPRQYGTVSLQDIETLMTEKACQHGYEILPYQSNHEGDLIDKLQEQSSSCAGIIINPGAFTHYSYALYDALVDTRLPIIEVHLSAIHAREEWRRTSVTAPASLTLISGKKEQGYLEALAFLVGHLENV